MASMLRGDGPGEKSKGEFYYVEYFTMMRLVGHRTCQSKLELLSFYESINGGKVAPMDVSREGEENEEVLRVDMGKYYASIPQHTKEVLTLCYVMLLFDEKAALVLLTDSSGAEAQWNGPTDLTNPSGDLIGKVKRLLGESR